MSFLRGSTNYVWTTTSVLGKGATGAVFQGVSKHDGEPVAVKTFNQVSHLRPHEVQMREFEVLKKVKHENIVKLLAIEEEQQDAKGKVIVMELCTGGSLFNILDDPDNAYGVQEDEFLLVLEHLSAGMKHLRDNNLVHRDLKPGNILKYVADDGRTVYKLTDFGAARELDEDQEFVSLYGTEEYLHPDMYERAVLRKTAGKTFSAAVDLWSIGVTLYHVATGNLPFRPFGGRRNRETMYYITTKKASGVIAGIQTSENGPIDWSKELPAGCQLSAGLKALVTPLLAGLLEADTMKMWNFDRFFSEVTHMLKKKIVHVFYVNKLASLRIYMNPDDTAKDFQCLVLQQTDIPPVNQILLHKEDYLYSVISEDLPGRSYMTTNARNPVVLYHRENYNVLSELEPELSKFPTFPNHTAVENDVNYAKQTCSIGHAYKRRIEKLSLCSHLMHEAVHMLSSVIARLLSKIYWQSDHSKAMTQCLGEQLQTVLSCHQMNATLLRNHPVFQAQLEKLDSMLISITETLSKRQQTFSNLNHQLSSLVPAIHQLHVRYLQDELLRCEWKAATSDISKLSTAPDKASTYVRKLRESWQHLLRDRASRTLTYNDEQFHILEKIKMQKTGISLANLLKQECQINAGHLSEALADWYKMAQAVFLQTEILEKDLLAYDNNLKGFMISVTELCERYTQDIESITENMAHGDDSLPAAKYVPAKPIATQPVGKSEVVMFNRHMQELATVQKEVWNILKENTELVNQFQNLTFAYTDSTQANVN